MIIKRRLICSMVVLLCSMVGCSDDNGPNPDVGQDSSVDKSVGEAVTPDLPPAQDPTSFMTFNTGLAEGAVGFAKERQPLIIEELKKATAEVLCLQEVWADSDAQAIIDGLKAIFPHSFREKTEDTSTPKVRCELGAVLTLDGCVKTKCDPTGISASECVADPALCKSDYDTLTDECKLCLAGNTANPTACALGGAKDFVYDGRNGLVLLSRYPMQDAKYTALSTELIKRGVITATIGKVNVQCNHMPANLGVVPYPTGKPYASWVEEHAGVADDVVKTAPQSGCTVLMGDLNSGPAEGGLTGALEDNFKKFTTAGYQEPWSTPQCTSCKDNPLAGSEEDTWIDHVMFKGCSTSATYTYKRVMDGEVTVTPSGGTPQKTRLSDHYGLQAEMK